MKTLKILVATGLTLASVAAFAVGEPGTGITGTKHDWSATSGQTLYLWLDSKGVQTTYNTGTKYCSSGSVATNDCVQGTTKVQFGLCTKCHTPHQAKSTNLLWNHTLTVLNFSWDQPKTTAGTDYATFKGDTYKGPTTKCLSCHDGSLASTDGVWFNRQIVGGGKYVAPPGTLNSGHEVAEQDGTDGHMAGTHPVAMPYPLNGQPNTYNGVTSGAETQWSEFVPDPTVNGIRLFNDVGGNIIAGKVPGATGMECTSCHDVHNGKRAVGTILLTGKLAGGKADGYICTQCHNK